jgi:hypothetical protein
MVVIDEIIIHVRFNYSIQINFLIGKAGVVEPSQIA